METMEMLTLCSLCRAPGRARCSVCLSWYCSASCQALQWPFHRQLCTPPPPLLWEKEEGLSIKQVLAKGLETRDKENNQPRTCQPSEKEKVPQPKIPSGKSLPVTLENCEVPSIVDQLPSVHESVRKYPEPEVGSTLEEVVKSKVDSMAELNTAEKAVRTSLTPKTSDTKIDSVSNSKKEVPVSCKGSGDTKNSLKFDSKKSPNVKQDQSTTKEEPVNKNTTANSSVKKKDSKEKLPNLKLESKTVPPHQDEPSRVDIPVNAVEVNSNEIIAPSNPLNTTKSVPTPDAGLKPKPVSPSRPAPFYPPAVLSSALPPPVLPLRTSLPLCSPVLNADSPFKLCLRIAALDVSLEEMVAEMSAHEPPVVKGWKVGRQETLAVRHEGVWFRGLALRKSGEKFSIYLLDYGTTITSSVTDLRKLPEKFSKIPAYNLQCCLAGVSPVGGGSEWDGNISEAFSGLLNADLEYKLAAEVLGEVEGGRLAVKITGMEDGEDFGKLLVQMQFAEENEKLFNNIQPVKNYVDEASRSNPQGKVEGGIFTKSSSSKSDTSASMEKNPDSIHNPEQTKPNPTPTPSPESTLSPASRCDLSAPNKTLAVLPRIPRGEFLEGSTTASICFLDSPGRFFFCPVPKVDIFLEILTQTQENLKTLDEVDVSIGGVCLALDDVEQCWYRAEVTEVQGDNVTVFLIDYGRTFKRSKTDLRLLENFHSEPGLVVEAGLCGIVPLQGQEWSREEVEGAKILMDVGGETTFTVTKAPEDADSKRVPKVTIIDGEGTDLAGLMIQAELGKPPVKEASSLSKAEKLKLMLSKKK